MRRRLRVAAAVLASILVNGAVPGGALAYAADTADTPTAPAAGPPPAERQVELIAEEPNLTYWIDDTRSQPATGDQTKRLGLKGSSLRRLCTVPCGVPLGPGTYTLGVSRPNGQLVTVPPMNLRGDEVLKASYHSRWALRLAFFLGGVLTAAIGGAVAFSGDPTGGRQAAGAGVLTIGILGMATPFFIDDAAHIVPVSR